MSAPTNGLGDEAARLANHYRFRRCGEAFEQGIDHLALAILFQCRHWADIKPSRHPVAIDLQSLDNDWWTAYFWDTTDPRPFPDSFTHSPGRVGFSRCEFDVVRGETLQQTADRLSCALDNLLSEMGVDLREEAK